MCFVFIWEQTATCATYSINWLVFITQMKSVYSAVRTGALNKAVCAPSVKGLITVVEWKYFSHNTVLCLWRFQVSSCCSNLTGDVCEADILCSFIDDPPPCEIKVYSLYYNRLKVNIFAILCNKLSDQDKFIEWWIVTTALKVANQYWTIVGRRARNGFEIRRKGG